jgi:small-conductance mechanosensitive channel
MNIKVPDLSTILPVLAAGLPTALITIAAAVVLNSIVRRALLLLAHRTTLTEEEVMPVHRVIKWLIVTVAFVIILSAFGVSIGGFWGILSTILAMIAIGFVAVWSVLSNTLCTVIIMLFRPFSVGDDIEMMGDPVKGRVIDLNFVYTTLDVGDGSVMQVPNNLFFQKVIRRRHSAVPVSPAAHLRTKRSDATPAPRLAEAEVGLAK